MASIDGEHDIRYSFIYFNNKIERESIYLLFWNYINLKRGLSIVESWNRQ